MALYHRISCFQIATQKAALQNSGSAALLLKSSIAQGLQVSDIHLKFARPSRSVRCQLIDGAQRRILSSSHSWRQVRQEYPSGCKNCIPLSHSGHESPISLPRWPINAGKSPFVACFGPDAPCRIGNTRCAFGGANLPKGATTRLRHAAAQIATGLSPDRAVLLRARVAVPVQVVATLVRAPV